MKSTAELIIFILYLLAMIGIGVYFFFNIRIFKIIFFFGNFEVIFLENFAHKFFCHVNKLS